MKKLIALALLLFAVAGVGFAIAAVGGTTHTSKAHVELKTTDGVVWKHEWRW